MVLVVVTCVNPCVNPRLRTKPGVCQSKKLAIGSLKLYYTFFFLYKNQYFSAQPQTDSYFIKISAS